LIFLLDTNVVIKLLRGDLNVLRRLRQHNSLDIGLPAIIMHELYFDAFNGRHTNKTIAFIERLTFDVVDFKDEDARCAAESALRSTPPVLR
jgi:tRNA(fMet)-specific endonuclease VapC